MKKTKQTFFCRKKTESESAEKQILQSNLHINENSAFIYCFRSRRFFQLCLCHKQNDDGNRI